MSAGHLYAKSAPFGVEALQLGQHLRDCEQAACELFLPSNRLGESLLRFCRLENVANKYRLNLRVACLFHDMGKANASFQAAVQGSKVSQVLRHEHLSALILHLPAVRQWLAVNRDLDLEAITGAVLSHHLKANDEAREAIPHCRWCQPQGSLELALHLQHADIQSTFQRIAAIAGLPGPMPSLPTVSWFDGSPWSDALVDGRMTANRYRRSLHRDEGRAQFLVGLKIGLIAADSIASGLVREGESIEKWLAEVGRLERLTPETLQAAVIEPRIRKAPNFKWHRFQELAGEQPSRALLMAACGAGKTLAAWRWAQRQVATQNIGRVIFLYPTRGTATEGFRDYVSAAPDGEAALVHGTSRYELDAMLRNPNDRDKAHAHGIDEAEARLFALAYWSRRYFSATIDQFLAFLEHSYASLCLVPALADSALILDEVHSFDAHMFDALLTFLRRFDLPVLCMTATLSPERRRRLEEAGLRSFPDAAERAELADLERAEAHPRYRLTEVEGPEAAFELVRSAYERGRRVLWVVNRVAECQRLAQRLRADLGADALCYHSRFRLMDRQRWHQATIAAFQQAERSAIAVTTQVCEMSLDLDADLLVTELAPPSSLVQRFGRANRKLARGPDFLADLVVYRPAKAAPYDSIELERGEELLSAVRGKPVSQQGLAHALEHLKSSEVPGRDGTALFEGGYYAIPGSFRDTDEGSKACILDSDVEAVLQCKKARTPYDGYVLTVPRKVSAMTPNERLPPFLNVVSCAPYSTELGYLDEGVA